MTKKDHVFTLGIEEEFQIIDPETRAPALEAENRRRVCARRG